MQSWSLSYRVGTTQDRLTRYAEVKSAVTIPLECVDDETKAHELTESYVDVDEPPKPYAIYTSGTREGLGYTLNVKLDPNA